MYLPALCLFSQQHCLSLSFWSDLLEETEPAHSAHLCRQLLPSPICYLWAWKQLAETLRHEMDFLRHSGSVGVAKTWCIMLAKCMLFSALAIWKHRVVCVAAPSYETGRWEWWCLGWVWIGEWDGESLWEAAVAEMISKHRWCSCCLPRGLQAVPDYIQGYKSYQVTELGATKTKMALMFLLVPYIINQKHVLKLGWCHFWF